MREEEVEKEKEEGRNGGEERELFTSWVNASSKPLLTFWRIFYNSFPSIFSERNTHQYSYDGLKIDLGYIFILACYNWGSSIIVKSCS